jgi:hypothetical protein
MIYRVRNVIIRTHYFSEKSGSAGIETGALDL